MKTVVGLMDNFSEATVLVRDLENIGFSRDSISFIANKDNAPGVGSGKGAAAGGISGLVKSPAEIALSGIGPVVAGGPVESRIRGGGGIIAGLNGMGIPEEHADYYAEGLRRGSTFVAVETDDASVDRAADIMVRHGAVDIDQRAAHWKKGGWKRFDERAAAFTPEQRAREAVLPVTEEEVKIGKREVAKGGVRVHSYVTERPVEEKISLREEHAKVERRPVDRPLAAGEEAFKERTYEIRETAEEPVVSKETRVKEEVVVGKETTERVQTIRETVRRMDVDVEYDRDFQTHFKSAYGPSGARYDDYSDAYRYGMYVFQDKRYGNKDWSSIEGDVRGDWEREHPGTWSKFRDAIHYGWDRMKHRPKKAA